MDRNTFTGLFLIMIVLAGSFYFFKPTEAEIKKEQQRITADSLKKAGVTSYSCTCNCHTLALPVADSAALKGPFGGNITGTVQTSVLENENLKLTFTNKGGKILSVQVKGQKTYDGKPVILFDGDQNKFGLNLNIGGKIVSTNDLYFTATQNAGNIIMRASYAADKYIEYVYNLKPNSSQVGFNINLNGLNQVIQGNQIALNWEATLLEQEKSGKKEQEHSAPYYKYKDKNPDHLNVAKDEEEELKEGKIEWFSFKQHFFSAVMIPSVPFEKGSLEVKVSTEPGKIKWYGATMQIPFNQLATQSYAMNILFWHQQVLYLKSSGTRN